MKNKHVYLLIFVLIIAIASFLRLWRLDQLPTSLYWEEVALGYDAFSLLQTGKDHHGNSWPIVAFESFGDWKPSGYFYAIIPFMAVLGLSEWSVRLPAALSGILLVILIGMLARKLLPSPSLERSRAVQLLVMALVTISPWAVMFSRVAWEVNLATMLLVGGVVAFLSFTDRALVETRRRFNLKKEEKTILLLIIAAVCFCFSMYAYHALRLVAPLLGGVLIWRWFERFQQSTTTDRKQNSSLFYFIQKNARFLLVGLGVSLFLLMPLVISLGNVQTNQRFNETNIFADLELLKEAQSLQDQAGDTWLSRLFYHRYLIYGQQVLSNALSHTTVSFLFVSGDQNARHSTQFIGLLYHIEAVFLVLGGWYVVKYQRRTAVLLGLWLLIGLLPAALTKATPHALRILPTLPVWMILISAGVIHFYELVTSWWSNQQLPVTKAFKRVIRVLLLGVMAAAYLIEFTMFWRFYTQVYVEKYAGDFMSGYKEMVQGLAVATDKLPDHQIYITRELGRPAMYYWFYNQTDPRLVQQQDETATKDQGEYLSFSKVKFVDSLSTIIKPAIIVASAEQFTIQTARNLDNLKPDEVVVRDRAGKIVWVIFELK